MFVHDYNNKGFEGIKKAIEEVEAILNVKLMRVPIPDNGGTVVIRK